MDALARWLSILAHPLALLPLGVGLTLFSRLAPRPAAVLTLVLLTGTLVPPALWVAWQVRRGTWSHPDVTDRRERYHLYPVLVGVAGLALAALAVGGAPAFVLRLCTAATAMLAAAAILNLRLKVSLHTACAAFVAVLALAVSPPLGAGLAALTLAVAWSRHRLRRHSLPELAAGLVLGLLAGAAGASF